MGQRRLSARFNRPGTAYPLSAEHRRGVRARGHGLRVKHADQEPAHRGGEQRTRRLGRSGRRRRRLASPWLPRRADPMPGHIPEDKLSDIYSLLHYFRLGLEASEKVIKPVMQFAGCWQDMPDEEFAAFTQEIAERRQRAFSTHR